MTTSKKEQEKSRQTDKETIEQERERALRRRFIWAKGTPSERTSILEFILRLALFGTFGFTMYYIVKTSNEAKESGLWNPLNELLLNPEVQAWIIGMFLVSILLIFTLYFIYVRKTKTNGKRK